MSNIVLSSVTPNATTIKQNGTSQQQKSQLPNPFKLDEFDILNKVYLTHVNDDEKYDKKILNKLVSDILSASAQISGTNSLVNTQVSFKPDFPALKRISCQIIMTRGTTECAHQTTMSILQHLRRFSWDAKALIAVAAFSLEYGEFMHLHRVQSSDTLGNSLRQLNQVQSRKVPTDITNLVPFLLQVLQHISRWADYSAMGYDLEEVRSLSDASQEIPLAVYWIIATIVASTGNLVGISEHKLSDYREKLSTVDTNLNDHLEKCKLQTESIDENLKRLKDSENHKGVVRFLKLLIEGNGSAKPLIYKGTTQVKTGIEVFNQNYVLLFISGLDSIGDEIQLLNGIYNKLQDKPQEVINNIKKEDLKVLWIPIADKWDEDHKNKFKDLKESIKWYVLEYFSELPGRGIIRKNLNYDLGKDPIFSVINPQGVIINQNAREIIFQWGFDAFPFRESDADVLVRKWAWFWNLMKKVDVNINIEDMKKDSYIFIYGGKDTKWIQDFTRAIGRIKKHQNIKNVDITIDFHQLGKQNPKMIPYFWMGIEGRKQNKPCQEKIDCEIQKVVRNLLCLKQDPLGWVLLSKGRHVTVWGHGEPMYQTVADFEKWKNNVVEKESFDIAFKEYYDTKLTEITSGGSCSFDSSNVLATITCPNPACGRAMEVSSVNYKCCHRDDPNSCCI